MDFKNIEAFLQVVDKGSFSIAAQTLYITQPTISLRIQRLEEELKIKLFQRVSGKKVVVTEAGEKILPYYQEAYRLIIEGNQSLISLQQATEKLVIATPNHMGEKILPELLKAVQQSHPNVNFSIKISVSSEIIKDIRNGEIDIGVVYMEEEEDNELTFIQVADEKIVLVSSPDHPLAKKKVLTVSDLQQEKIILYSKTFINSIMIAKYLKEHGLKNYETTEIRNLEWIKMMAKNGLGITFLQRIIVKDDLKNRQLVELPLQNVLPTTPISLVFNKNVSHKIQMTMVKTASEIFRDNY
jgi:DNA-binding transcriptional LysR family regulator